MKWIILYPRKCHHRVCSLEQKQQSTQLKTLIKRVCWKSKVGFLSQFTRRQIFTNGTHDDFWLNRFCIVTLNHLCFNQQTYFIVNTAIEEYFNFVKFGRWKYLRRQNEMFLSPWLYHKITWGERPDSRHLVLF